MSKKMKQDWNEAMGLRNRQLAKDMEAIRQAREGAKEQVPEMLDVSSQEDATLNAQYEYPKLPFSLLPLRLWRQNGGPIARTSGAKMSAAGDATAEGAGDGKGEGEIHELPERASTNSAMSSSSFKTDVSRTRTIENDFWKSEFQRMSLDESER